MQDIQYELDSRPSDGETMAVADGISWLRMPLPFQLNHINLWLLRDEGGWVIVDTGLYTSTTREIWQKVFADDMRNDPATHVVVTHLHPDHAGCANWLVEQFGVDLWMTLEEYLLCRVLIVDTGGWYKLCCPTSQLHKPDVLGAIYRVRRKDSPSRNHTRYLSNPRRAFVR